MLVSGVKSRPTYAPIGIDPAGRSHVFVVDAGGVPVAVRCLEKAAALGIDPASVQIHVLGHTPASFAGFSVDVYGHLPDLLAGVKGALARSFMGTRLYVAGAEAFLWEVNRLAMFDFGFARDEAKLELGGGLARKVFCVHCRTVNEGVTTNIHTCSGCGEHLLVRDHFSRNLGAYMGVSADAEEPGILPEREEVFK